jgi:hypothetical protein
MWGQPPSAVRRAQLDLFSGVILSVAVLQAERRISCSTGAVPTEIPRPAGENALLRDDAVECIQHENSNLLTKVAWDFAFAPP